MLTADTQAKLAAEAAAACAGLEVRDFVDTVGGGILMLLASPGADHLEHRLLIVAEPRRARLHLAPARRPDRPRPKESAFVRDARASLRGGRITAIHAAAGDRTVFIDIDAPDAPDAPDAKEPSGTRLQLVAELFGAAPNVLVVGQDHRIRALKRSRRGSRPAAVGSAYQPPAAASPRADARVATLPGPPPGPFGDAHPVSAAIDAHFLDADILATMQAERQTLVRSIEGVLSREARRHQQVRCDLESAGESGRARELADLLNTRFSDLRRGMASIEVEDLYRGGSVTIPLDPLKEPRANIDALYRRAGKAERAAERAREREPRIVDRLRRLEALGDAARDAPDRAALATVSERFHAAFEVRVQRPRKQIARQDKGASPSLRRFRLKSGLIVEVGRTDRDNDLLTTRIVKGDDIWMHVLGEAGSHVLVRVPRGKTASLEDLLDGGCLAVHFSKRRGATRCDVMYTHRKYVRKPRGAKPGAVTVERHKTLHVRADEARLRSLLAGDEQLPR